MNGDGYEQPGHLRSASSKIGGPVVEGDVARHPRRQSVYGPGTAGSYGFLLKSIAEGLEIALTRNWLTEDEAKREYRSHVQVVQEDEVHADQVAELEAHVAQLEEDLFRAKAKVEGRKGS